MALAGGRTPEELEALFEDACLLRDRAALAQLFEPGAVLQAVGSLPQARGREQVIGLLVEMWDQERAYVADPRSILQAPGTSLILSERAINVVRRSHDASWRYAIMLHTGSY